MKTKKENHYCKLCKKYLGERGSDNDEEFYNSTCIDCADDLVRFTL